MDIVKPTDAGGGGTATEPEQTTAPAPDATEGPEGGEKKAAEPAGRGAIKLPASMKLQKPQKPTGRFQARISDLVGQRDQATEEARRLREQLSKMQGIPRGGDGTDDSAAAADPNAPLSPDDFNTYGEYVEALVQRTMESREKARGSERAEQAYAQYRQEKLDLFNERAVPIAEQFGEGFWDAITDPALPITEAMADAILELDDLGPYTMLWLAVHRDEALRLAKMNPRQATIAVGRLAARLDQEIKAGVGTEAGAEPAADTSPAAPATPTPGAPRPTLVPVPRGSAPATDAAPSDKDSIEEWLRKETDRMRRINPNAKFYGAR